MHVCDAGGVPRSDAAGPAHPGWFTEFLADRAIRKLSPHTAKAYRQDFEAIATSIAGGPEDLQCLSPAGLTKDNLRVAFAVYAENHSAASIRRCWSTWNTLCTYLYTAELISDNPMPVVGRPKVPKSLPKSYSVETVRNLIAGIDANSDIAGSRNEWPERDRAIIFTSLLAGLRADELLRANTGDLRRTDDGGGVFHVRGKGSKDRRIPVGPELLDVLDIYLTTRAARFPHRVDGQPAPPYLSASRPPLHCSSAPTATASRGERCSIDLFGRSRRPVSTAKGSPAHWYTGCATLSPPNSPTPMSVSTH